MRPGRKSPTIPRSSEPKRAKSRVFQEETREVAEGERIRFTTYDKELGVRAGDLGTVARIGQDHSMTVKMDSGKIAEVPPEKARHIDYGYAVDSLKNVRAERVIATGDGLTQHAFQQRPPKRTSLYTPAHRGKNSLFPRKSRYKNSPSRPSNSMILELGPKVQICLLLPIIRTIKT